MAADLDLIKLYSQRILALAADMPHARRLANPQVSAHRRAPLCGSTVTVDLSLENGAISEFGQDVKACALGQAAAAIFAAHVIGLRPDDVQLLRDQVSAMLKDNGPVPPAPFDAFEVLLPARDYKNRHASILLSLDATCTALDQAAQSDCA